VNHRRLHLLLAPKERFEPAGAGAFALNVLETSRVSRWKSGITVFGSPVAQPFTDVAFRPIAAPKWSLRGRNVAMALRYANAVKREPPDLVEVYNRPVMVDPLRRRLAGTRLILHLGNDPRGMDGSRSVAERKKLLAQCDAIVCVSEFMRRCFLDGVDDPLFRRAGVIHTGVQAPAAFPDGKDKTIVFVGRVVPEKGVLHLVQALVRVLPQHPSWTAHIIGARWFANSGALSSYEKEVLHAARQSERILAEGFRPHDDVIAALRKASIAVVPSCWDEPGHPRTADEALAQGAALICSKRGGIPEIGLERALFVDEVSADSLAAALNRLMSDDAELRALQRRGWEDFPFEITRTTRHLDDLRAQVMERN
jgi:glycosyltransferase involved in cell wall biosynthesis